MKGNILKRKHLSPQTNWDSIKDLNLLSDTAVSTQYSQKTSCQTNTNIDAKENVRVVESNVHQNNTEGK